MGGAGRGARDGRQLRLSTRSGVFLICMYVYTYLCIFINVDMHICTYTACIHICVYMYR